jgi:hypothetical protein
VLDSQMLQCNRGEPNCRQEIIKHGRKPVERMILKADVLKGIQQAVIDMVPSNGIDRIETDEPSIQVGTQKTAIPEIPIEMLRSPNYSAEPNINNLRDFINNLKKSRPSTDDNSRYTRPQPHMVDMSSMSDMSDMSDMTSMDGMTDMTSMDGMTDMSSMDGMTDMSSMDGMTDMTSMDGMTDMSGMDGMPDGLSGRNSREGRNSRDGRDGRNSRDGRDGRDGRETDDSSYIYDDGMDQAKLIEMLTRIKSKKSKKSKQTKQNVIPPMMTIDDIQRHIALMQAPSSRPSRQSPCESGPDVFQPATKIPARVLRQEREEIPDKYFDTFSTESSESSTLSPESYGMGIGSLKRIHLLR